jgi:hypothetical protein
MPEFKLREAERERRKAEALAPFVAAAMARKQPMPPLAEAEVPIFAALGRPIAQNG